MILLRFSIKLRFDWDHRSHLREPEQYTRELHNSGLAPPRFRKDMQGAWRLEATQRHVHEHVLNMS